MASSLRRNMWSAADRLDDIWRPRVGPVMTDVLALVGGEVARNAVAFGKPRSVEPANS